MTITTESLQTKLDILRATASAQAILRAHTPLDNVNMRAWKVFVRDAKADKVWAENVTEAFLRASCDETRKMARKYRQTPTLVLAAQHYGYSYYRGHSRVGIYWIDPSAKKLWDEFEAAEATTVVAET